MLQFGDKLIQAAPEESAPPILTIPNGAGLQGQHELVIQVLINFWGGKITGVADNCGNGKFHRFEVVRQCPLKDYSEDVDAWLRVRVGKKAVDTSLRVPMRTSMILRKAPSYGLTNIKPWLAAMSEVDKAITWAVHEARIHKQNQYALLLAVHTTQATAVKPVNTAYETYMEAEITAILQAEAVLLTPNPGDLAMLEAARIGGEEDDDGEDANLPTW